MNPTIVFDREDGWAPKVILEDGGLWLSVVGGADALHDPRTFRFPIEEAHLQALRESPARHMILWSAVNPLCHAAGIRGPLDEGAAVALLDPILLARPDAVDAFLQDTSWDRLLLVAHGADIEMLDNGRILESMGAGTGRPDWRRAQEYDAARRRAQKGVTLSALDTAILRFTGQYVHGSTIPHRDPDAVDPALLVAVLQVIETAERACTGLRIVRDPRGGPTGTDKQDWKRMEAAVEAALREGHPELADDAREAVRFLLCSEAAKRGRKEPFDIDASGAEEGASSRDLVLNFFDDQDAEKTWKPGDEPGAVESFWQFVAERYGSRNQVFTVEVEEPGEGIVLYFYADSIARIETIADGDGETAPERRVEYALIDGLAHYRAMVRDCITGGFAALDGLARWTSDHAELEAARRRRDDPDQDNSSSGA